MSLDPKVATTLEPYQYVGNDPLNETDPTGECIAGAGGGCVAIPKPKPKPKRGSEAATEAAVAAAIQAADQQASDAAAQAQAAEAAQASHVSTPAGAVVLSSTQITNGEIVEAAGLSAGLTSNQALQLVGVAYQEASLVPTTVRPSNGACGLFQLLYSSYQATAAARGGCKNPIANTSVLLPNYVSYFATHPNAAEGAAAAWVEQNSTSPTLASEYAANLSWLGEYFNG